MKTLKLLAIAFAFVSLAACGSATTEEAPAADSTAVVVETTVVETPTDTIVAVEAAPVQ